MRRKVRNIFHIDMDATLPEILTETIHFETLVISFSVLRSTGFTHDPPFVLEPDYIGTPLRGRRHRRLSLTIFPEGLERANGRHHGSS